MLPAPEVIHLTVPTEEADSWRRTKAAKDPQGIQTAGMETTPILPKQYLIPIAKCITTQTILGLLQVSQTLGVLKN